MFRSSVDLIKWFFGMILTMSLPCWGQAEDLNSVPLILDESSVSDGAREEALITDWRLQSSFSAFRAGFLEIAIELTEQVLLAEGLPLTQRNEATARLGWLYLMTGKYDEVASLATESELKGLPFPLLLDGYLAYYAGDLISARSILQNIEASSLNESERPWLALFNALVVAVDGDNDMVNQAFNEAESSATEPVVRSHFQILRIREELKRVSTTEDSIRSLRQSARTLDGERSGFEANRLLAIALNQLGRKSEAIDILNSQLSRAGLRESGLRGEFLLQLGLIDGSEGVRGRLALVQILSEDEPVRIQDIALSLLTQSAEDSSARNRLLNELSSWLSSELPHPLADKMYYLRSVLRMQLGRAELARDDALVLIEQFPSSSYINNAYWILAHASWLNTPPLYRTAADYLNQLSRRLPAGSEKQQVDRMRADCFFLNGDFLSSSEAYASVLRDITGNDRNPVFFQLIISELRTGDLQRVGSLLDEAHEDSRVGIETLWQSEWNYLNHLMENGQLESAEDRITELLSKKQSLAPDLRVRFEWLRAQIELKTGDYRAAIVRSSDLLDATDNGGAYSELDDTVLEQVKSHAMLIQGEAAFRSGSVEEGKEIFTRLRANYADSGPAILSFLVEARSATEEENLVTAQQTLIGLADLFPETKFAPVALWEAALNAEQRGLNQHLREAISIHERIVNQYPDHRLVFYSRLKQGDLARNLNDFGTAMLLYDRLLNTFGDHPEIWRAEINRADCLLALSSQDENRLSDAAVAYERLAILPNDKTPVRIEAGFKWAQTIRMQGDLQRYESVLWLLYDKFLIEEELAESISLSQTGRYWMARLILELGGQTEGKGRVAQARVLYNKLIELGLPGKSTATSRLQLLDNVE